MAEERRRSKAEQSQATREALVQVARELFAEQGFSGTATEEIVERAGVTRGALYHQFRDKRDLFLAVMEAVQGELSTRLLEATATVESPLGKLRAGFAEYLDASMDPRVARIALTEARAVLGWEEWRRIETENGYAMTFAMLEAAIQAGEIPAQPAGPLAHLLLGAANEAAFLIAGADDPSRTRAEMGEALDRLMRSLASP